MPSTLLTVLASALLGLGGLHGLTRTVGDGAVSPDMAPPILLASACLLYLSGIVAGRLRNTAS